MAGNEIDFDQVAVERLVHDLQTGADQLRAFRNNPMTAQFVTDEEVNIGSALTTLQFVATDLLVSRPKTRLQVVR